ncbi:MAG: hypothetical protein AB1403_11130, partial [Candidatus Riflebacteria bacterium]
TENYSRIIEKVHKNRILLLILLLQAGILSAQVNVATRLIGNFNSWPKAYHLAISSKPTLQLQSLDRLIFNHRTDSLRFRFEAEMAVSWYSKKALKKSGDWQTGNRNTGFKAWQTGSEWLERNNWRGTHEIERCELAFSSGNFDIQVGRQPISFGTSHFVSAMDVLSPFQPGYLDSSYKPGIDAIRIRTISGSTGEAEVIFAAAAKPQENAVILRRRDTYSGIDVEMIAGRFRERNFAALGWEGERRKINCWGEMGLFQRLNGVDHIFGGISKSLASSWIIGFDKDTGSDWRHGIAYLHQDFGAEKVNDYSNVYLTRPLQQNWVHLVASDYLVFNSSREISPLVNLNLNAIVNMIDHSVLFQPVLSISLDDESDVSLFGWLNSGARPAVNGRVQTEFGSFPAGGGFIYRRFF